ncbi:hypothetical protein V8F33_009617 [Rhypophila sp. PSN 637]
MVDAYLIGDWVVLFAASCFLQRLSAQDDAALDNRGFMFGSLTALPRSTVTALAMLSLTLSPALGTPHLFVGSQSVPEEGATSNTSLLLDDWVSVPIKTHEAVPKVNNRRTGSNQQEHIVLASKFPGQQGVTALPDLRYQVKQHHAMINFTCYNDGHLPQTPPRHRRQVRFLPKSSDVIISPQAAETRSILRLISEPNQVQQQSRPARTRPPSKGYRNPAPEDIENWLDDSADSWRQFPEPRAPLSPGWRRSPIKKKESISPLALGPSISSSSGLFSPFISATAISFSRQPPQSQPESQPLNLTSQLRNLKDTIQTSREAETLHAYDVGVIAALNSMLVYWTDCASAMQTSSAEKRIFQREAQRLTDLIDDAERHLLLSHASLVNKQAVEEDLWEDVFSASPPGTEASSVGLDIISQPVPPRDTMHQARAVGTYYTFGSGRLDGERHVCTCRARAALQNRRTRRRGRGSGSSSPGFMEDAEIIHDQDEVMSDLQDWVTS